MLSASLFNGGASLNQCGGIYGYKPRGGGPAGGITTINAVATGPRNREATNHVSLEHDKRSFIITRPKRDKEIVGLFMYKQGRKFEESRHLLRPFCSARPMLTSPSVPHEPKYQAGPLTTR